MRIPRGWVVSKPRGYAWPVLGALVLLGAGPAQEPSPTARTRTVEIQGMAFRPEVTEAALGDTIVWINRDIVPHTATAARGAGWDTGTFGRAESRRVVVSRRGETAYFCALHPTMRGTVRVR